MLAPVRHSFYFYVLPIVQKKIGLNSTNFAYSTSTNDIKLNSVKIFSSTISVCVTTCNTYVYICHSTTLVNRKRTNVQNTKKNRENRETNRALMIRSIAKWTNFL